MHDPIEFLQSWPRRRGFRRRPERFSLRGCQCQGGTTGGTIPVPESFPAAVQPSATRTSPLHSTLDTMGCMDEDEIIDRLAAAIPTVGVAVVAFCVWLGVRLYNRRERWVKLTLMTTLIGVPLLYFVVFGTVCRATSQPTAEWRANNVAVPANAVDTVLYRPLGAAATKSAAIRWVVHGYLRLWVPGGRIAKVPVRDDGHIMVFEFR